MTVWFLQFLWVASLLLLLGVDRKSYLVAIISFQRKRETWIRTQPFLRRHFFLFVVLFDSLCSIVITFIFLRDWDEKKKNRLFWVMNTQMREEFQHKLWSYQVSHFIAKEIFQDQENRAKKINRFFWTSNLFGTSNLFAVLFFYETTSCVYSVHCVTMESTTQSSKVHETP